MERIEINQILKNTYNTFKRNPQPLILSGLVYSIASLLSLYAAQIFKNGSLEISILIQVLLTSFVSIAMIFLSTNILGGKDFILSKELSAILSKYPIYVSLIIAYMIIIAAGVFLLIIPAIYFSVIFTFANIIIVLEEQSFINAFKRSFSLVKGNFWIVLMFNFILFALTILPGQIFLVVFSSIPSVGRILSLVCTVFIIPYAVLAQVSLYLRLKDEKKEEFII